MVFREYRALGVVGSAVLSSLLLPGAGCGGGSGDGGGDGGASFGLAQRVAVTTLTFPTGAPRAGALNVRRRFPLLAFEEPVYITAPLDGRGRLVVVEREGRIRIFENDDAVAASDVFLDISGRVDPAGEGGLLGLAFHPDYASNGLLYVYYTAGNPFRSRVSMFRRTAGNPDAANPSSEDVLLEFLQPFTNHNAGMIAFGPDGMLYIASGDGGSGNDPQNNGQSLGTLLGKILRIAPDGSVPADNPFIGVAGARAEIWAYGLRNPWRFSFDRNLGTLWAADVGQAAIEEIDIIERGGNYGWRIYEGNRSNINPSELPPTAFEQPVITYDHTIGVSITGGYVYRGSRLAGFQGLYFYADFSSGRVWALRREAGSPVSTTQVASMTTPVSFGEDEDGELYVVSFNGSIHDFEPVNTDPEPAFPEVLSATGVFTSLAPLAAAPGLIEYDVNSPLWADGAAERRWIALPGTSTIDFADEGPWTFPPGTVLVMHFEWDRSPAAPLPIETRVLIHHADGWQGYSYRWRADGSDADLLSDSATGTFRVPDGSGGEVDRTWFFPSRTDCLRCHTGAAGRVLGARTAQLNRTFSYPLVEDNQLRAWNHIGLFGRNIGAADQYPALADPLDPAAPLEARARSYLDANCAQCHLPSGPTSLDLDLRAATPLAEMRAVDVPPSEGNLGLSGARRIAPGAKESSVLWERMRRLDGIRMPPLASREVDQDAVEVIGAWIDGLTP